MVRTQIQLTEKQAKALKALAAKQGVSIAELIRGSVDQMLCAADAAEQEKRRRAIAFAGRFSSGLSDLSVEHDRYLEAIYADEEAEE